MMLLCFTLFLALMYLPSVSDVPVLVASDMESNNSILKFWHKVGLEVSSFLPFRGAAIWVTAIMATQIPFSIFLLYLLKAVATEKLSGTLVFEIQW